MRKGREQNVLSAFSVRGSVSGYPTQCTHRDLLIQTPSHPEPTRSQVKLQHSQNLLNIYYALNRTNGDLIMVIDNNKKIPPPLEDKLIHLFKPIHFQPIVLIGYLIEAHLH